MVVFVSQIPGLGISQSGGKGRATVPHVEVIKGALVPFRVPAEPSLPPQGVKAILSAGQQLVGVGLVPHVEDNAVLSKIEGAKQRHDELHGSQGGGEVPAVFQRRFDDLFPKLRAEPGQCPWSEAL